MKLIWDFDRTFLISTFQFTFFYFDEEVERVRTLSFSSKVSHQYKFDSHFKKSPFPANLPFPYV